MTTFEPGDRLVLTQGWLRRPRSTAFLASRPAATITDGLEVLVHEVMAAMATAPWSTMCSSPVQRRRRPGSVRSREGLRR